MTARERKESPPSLLPKGGIVYSVREPIFPCFTTPSMKHRLRLQLRAVLSSLVRMVGKNSIATEGEGVEVLLPVWKQSEHETECHRLVNKQTYT
ncbi:hypothetical protein CDAR_569081 [Caerostris darwini]|uniref:Uncharacterized protein n=1 Tax=Caerostris darwini TaxID=1538125 RepID=A0AAV4QAI3_9ARAC|nr:hypothetical protein CDAR_569081 [Caerostris darwini]